MSYSTDEYMEGYKHGWYAGSRATRINDWLMLAIGAGIGVTAAILITVSL